jgi:hypothetical protein
MKQVLKDWFSENRGGKFSSKKLWGHVFCLLVAVTYVMDGFNFFKVTKELFNSMLIAGTTLLGLRIISKMINRNGSDSTSK